MTNVKHTIELEIEIRGLKEKYKNTFATLLLQEQKAEKWDNICAINVEHSDDKKFYIFEQEIKQLKEYKDKVESIAKDDKFWHKAYEYYNLKEKLEKIGKWRDDNFIEGTARWSKLNEILE